jgi:UDP-GlcNAc:undecaprenyl-phosphate/decaprenyl-phosphate GlcNAc-1-phosphate transferase
MDELNFPLDRALLWLLLASAGTALTVGTLIRLAPLIGALDDPHQDGRRIHDRKIPRVGGIGFGLVFFSACLIQQGAFSSPWIIGGGLVLMLVGIVDDILGLRPRMKFIAHVTAMSMAVLGAHAVVQPIPLLGPGTAIDTWWICAGLTIFIGVGMINAMNLIDGLDGLAASIAGIASGCIAILAALHQDIPACLAAMTLAGCMIGVLGFNAHPAKVFLGDTGSMLLGYLLSCFSIRLVIGPAPEGMVAYSPLLPLLLLVIPWSDSLWVMFSRILRSKDPFSGDRTHVHHQVLGLGIRHRYAVMILLIIQLMIAILAIALCHQGDAILLLAIICIIQAAVGGIRFLGRNLSSRRLNRRPARWTRWYQRIQERTPKPEEPIWTRRLRGIRLLVLRTSFLSLILLFALSGLRPSGLLGLAALALMSMLATVLILTKDTRDHFVFFALFVCLAFLALSTGLWSSYQAHDPIVVVMRVLVVISFVAACIELLVSKNLGKIVSTPLELVAVALAASGVLVARFKQDFNTLAVSATCICLFFIAKATFSAGVRPPKSPIVAIFISLGIFVAIQAVQGGLFSLFRLIAS